MLSELAVVLALCLQDHLVVVSYSVLGMLAQALDGHRSATPSSNLDRNRTFMYTPTAAYSLSALIGLIVGTLFVIAASPALPVVLACRRTRRHRTRRLGRGRQARRPPSRHRARSRFRLRGGDALPTGVNRVALRNVTRSVRRFVSILDNRAAAEHEVEEQLSSRIRADGGFDQFCAELCELDGVQMGEAEDELSEEKHVPPAQQQQQQQQLSAQTLTEVGWEELCAEVCEHMTHEAEERPEQTGGGEEEESSLPALKLVRHVAVLVVVLRNRATGSIETVHARILGASSRGAALADGIAGADCLTLHVPGASTVANRPGNAFFIHQVATRWKVDEDLIVESIKLAAEDVEAGPLQPTDVVFIAPPLLLTEEKVNEDGKPIHMARGVFALQSANNEMLVVSTHVTEGAERRIVKRDAKGEWCCMDATGFHTVRFGPRPTAAVSSPRSELTRHPLEASTEEELRASRNDATGKERKVSDRRRREAGQPQPPNETPPLFAPTDQSEPSTPPAEAAGVPNTRPLFDDTQNSDATPPLGQTMGPEEGAQQQQTSQPPLDQTGAEGGQQSSQGGGKTRPTPKMKGTGSPLGERPRSKASVKDEGQPSPTGRSQDPSGESWAAEERRLEHEAEADAEAEEGAKAAEVDRAAPVIRRTGTTCPKAVVS